MKRVQKILAILLCFTLVLKPITVFGAEITLFETELTSNQEDSEENSSILEQTTEPLETVEPEDSIIPEETEIPVINEEAIETEEPVKEEKSVSYVSKSLPTESELIANDYVLYFANCGAAIVDSVSSEDKMGLYQSVTDKEYGEDEKTSYHWGYRPNDTNSVKIGSGIKTSTKKEDTYWYVGEIEYISGTSGFYYDFEVPNGTYEVIVGFKNPWSGRPVNVVLEGTTVSEQLQLNENALVESKHKMEVTDGELNVFVHNPTRTDQYKDPILNYIIVKAIPAMDTTALEAKITLVQQQIKEAQDAGIVYATERLSELYLDAANKEDTITDLNAALLEGTNLVESGTASEKEIEEMIHKIDTIYSNLRTIEQYHSFSGTNGALWKDTNGVPIQAHGGQVQKIGDKWWWYGEDKTKGYRSNGISAYSSEDLYNWRFEGYVMRTITTREQLDTDTYFRELYKDYTPEQKDNVFLCINDSTAVIERPKMIYNEKTKKYVLWFHADGPTLEAPDSNYAAAAAGVAISDSPTGPFQFIDRHRLHVCPEDQKKGEWYEASAGFARDMNLFIDDDKKAYIIYSSEENRTMFISRLNEDYTYLDAEVETAVHGEDFVRLFPGAQREAPAIFKFNEKYYMITSGATGWAPNQAQYWVADEILGEWKNMGDPCVGDTNGKTFYTQSTNVITLEEGKYVYMGDRWNDSKLEDSRYVWLPVEIDGAGNLLLKEYKDWTLEELEGKNTVKLKTKLEDVYYNINDLPKEVQLQVRNSQGIWEDKVANVTWKTEKLLTGAKTAVTGSIDGIQTDITAYVVQLPDNLLYFIDSGAKSGSIIHQEAVKKVSGLRNKDAYDKAYIEGSWGYTGSTTDDIGFKNENSMDAYESGLWARGGKTIDYSIPLEAGNYELTAGFQEWWGTSRNMMVTLSYKTKEGELISKELGRFTNKSQMAVAYPFSISEDAEVTISVSKQASGNPDPVLSWIAVEVVTKDALQQAKDKALQTFDEFVSDVVARKDEFETEVWLKLEAGITKEKENINKVQTIEAIDKTLQQAKDNFIELQAELGILKNEPILQYDFEESLEGNTIKDISGNENNATLYGTATYVKEEGKGQVLYLDGKKGTYGELPVGMFDGMNQMTIVMDVKSQSTGNFFTFGIGKDSTNYMFLKTVGTTVKNSITKGSYSAEQVVSGRVDKEGEWSKVVIVVEEDKMTLYLNGKKVDEKTGITTKISDFGTGVLSYLGKSFYSADAYFKGYFDNISIYNKALSAIELADILGTEMLTELPTTLKKGETLELPEVVEVLSKGEVVEDNVIWELVSTKELSILGNQVTIKGRLEKTKKEIETTITVISKKLVYYVDAGNQSSESFEILKKNARMLKNEVPDQAYNETWGYIGVEGTEFGIRNTEGTDRYETGLFSKSGNDIVYKMQLEEGTYRMTAGFMEWWNQPRHMDITVEYTDKEGKTIETVIAENVGWNQVSGNVPESEKRKAIEGEFTIPIDTDITIHIKKHASSQDPVLSFFGLELLQSSTIRTGTIVNGEPWYDTEGDFIQAHGGDFLYENGTYYWFGENKSHNSAVLKGVSVYSSKDLVNWTYENDIITTESDPELESCKIERPKVVYNEATKKYVMWGHWEEADNYNYGHVVVATCDTITGNYKYLGHFDPGNQSRDFTLFVDEDKKAYLFTSANSNADMDVYLLNESYTGVKEKLYTIYAGQRREAPAVVKKDGYYYMLTSGQSGWQPNQGYYAYTTDITKKDAWSELYKFGNTSTFYSQPANILTVNGTEGTTYIYIGDRWNQTKLGDSRYIWLPFEMNQGKITMEYQRVWQINAETGLVQTPKSILISQNKKATASNETDEYAASNAVDGDFDTYFDTGVDSLPYWWSVDFGKEYDVSDIDISWRSWNGSEVYYKYIIEGSKDGENYETIVDASSNTTTSFTSHELTGRYRYIRISVIGQININNGNSATWYRGIHEVRVFGLEEKVIEPTATPSVEPTATPTVEPTKTPTATPTIEPTEKPTAIPTQMPIPPIEIPTMPPIQSLEPSIQPVPTVEPTKEPVDDSIVTLAPNVNIEVEKSQANVVASIDEEAIIKQIQEKTNTLQVEIILPSKQLQAELKKETVKKINVELRISEKLKENKKLDITSITLEDTVLKEAKEAKKDIVVQISDKEGNLQTQWSFYNDILQKTNKKLTDVNLLTSVTESKSEKRISDVLEKDKNNEKAVLLEIEQTGILPTQAELKVYVGKIDGIEKHTNMYLYYYNISTKKLEELKDSAEYKVDKDGYISIQVLKGGNYIILPKQPDSNVCTTLENQIKTTLEAKTIKVGDKTKKIKTVLPVSLKKVKDIRNDSELSSIGNVVITYTSSNKKIATVGKTTGKIIANKQGNVTFTTTIKLYDGRIKTIKNKVTIEK